MCGWMRCYWFLLDEVVFPVLFLFFFTLCWDWTWGNTWESEFMQSLLLFLSCLLFEKYLY